MSRDTWVPLIVAMMRELETSDVEFAVSVADARVRELDDAFEARHRIQTKARLANVPRDILAFGPALYRRRQNEAASKRTAAEVREAVKRVFKR